MSLMHIGDEGPGSDDRPSKWSLKPVMPILIVVAFMTMVIFAFRSSDAEQERHNKDFERWKKDTAAAFASKSMGDIVVYKGRLWIVMGKVVSEDKVAGNRVTGIYACEARVGAKLPEGFLITQGDNFETINDLEEVRVPYYWK